MQNMLSKNLKHCLFIITMLALTGCVFTPATPDSITVNKGNKIAILVDASQFPTHTHFGSFFSHEFVKKFEFDWNIEESIIQTLRDEIEANTEFKVVNLRTFGINNSKDAGFVRSKKGAWVYRADKTLQAKKLQEKGVNLVLNITEVKSIAAEECSLRLTNSCSPLYSQGYGLVSQGHLLGYNYFSSASFDTQLETLNPPSVLTRKKEFRAINKDSRLNQGLYPSERPRGPYKITEEDLAPIKREILKHFSDIGKRVVVYLNEKRI